MATNPMFVDTLNFLKYTKEIQMYVELNDTGRDYSKIIPIGCNVIGSVCDDDGLHPMMLVLSNLTGLYCGVVKGQMYTLDQNEILTALADASSRPGSKSDQTTPKLYSININTRTADILRTFGGGNLSKGVRMAADLIGGADHE